MLAYTCQILLQSISELRQEINSSYGFIQADEKIRIDLEATVSLLENQNAAGPRG